MLQLRFTCMSHGKAKRTCDIQNYMNHILVPVVQTQLEAFFRQDPYKLLFRGI